MLSPDLIQLISFSDLFVTHCNARLFMRVDVRRYSIFFCYFNRMEERNYMVIGILSRVSSDEPKNFLHSF